MIPRLHILLRTLAALLVAVLSGCEKAPQSPAQTSVPSKIEVTKQDDGSVRIKTSSAEFDLSPREREIVSALAEGLGNRDMAERFGLSEVTIKHHLNSIFDKCGVSNRLELALFALRHGLARL